MYQPISQVLRIPDSGTLGAGDSSTRFSLRFPRDCWVVGLTLACDEGNSAADRLNGQLLVSDGAQKAIISDGTAEAFAPVALLCPPDGSTGAGDTALPLPLVRRVHADELWAFQWKNAGAGSLSMQGALLIAEACPPFDRAQPLPACTRLPWCSRVLVVPGLNASLAVGETSPQCIVEMPSDGVIVGMRASAAGVRRNAMAVEVYDPERRQVVTTGVRAMAPIPLPLMAPGLDCTLPINVPRKRHDKMSVRVQNLSATLAFTPSVGFFYQDRGC